MYVYTSVSWMRTEHDGMCFFPKRRLSTNKSTRRYNAEDRLQRRENLKSHGLILPE
jgi:hypothetical protein